VRATGRFTLLVLHLESGDGVELIGRGDYTNVLADRRERREVLVQHPEPFPIQGVIAGAVERAQRLRGLTHPRARLERREKVTSCSTVDEQAPQ
jgi:hypothetical protein